MIMHVLLLAAVFGAGVTFGQGKWRVVSTTPAASAKLSL